MHSNGARATDANRRCGQRVHAWQVYGIYRNGRGLHRRLDIVVVAFPEELPFARLTWTGSRTLNRLLRQRAIQLGLHLTANGLAARPPHGVSSTTVLVDARPGRSQTI
jgi:DNA polymerase mu